MLAALLLVKMVIHNHWVSPHKQFDGMEYDSCLSLPI